MLKAHSKAWQVNAKYDPALDPGQKRERDREGGRRRERGTGRQREENGGSWKGKKKGVREEKCRGKRGKKQKKETNTIKYTWDNWWYLNTALSMSNSLNLIIIQCKKMPLFFEDPC